MLASSGRAPATQRACGKTVQPATAGESAGQSLNRVFERHRIEYIISNERFRSLPEDEKRLWHSHHYEVKSGELVAPGIPDVAEHAYFSDLVTTYGKTFHTWQYDRDDFPYGIPQLMMGFTADGQANEALIHDRDRKLGISTARKRQNRADIPSPEVAPGANSWESGRTVQTAWRRRTSSSKRFRRARRGKDRGRRSLARLPRPPVRGLCRCWNRHVSGGQPTDGAALPAIG